MLVANTGTNEDQNADLLGDFRDELKYRGSWRLSIRRLAVYGCVKHERPAYETQPIAIAVWQASGVPQGKECPPQASL